MPKNQAIKEFSNIRVTNDGFQVVFTRIGQEHTAYFAGHSEKSLRAAQRHRDRMLRELPSKRLNTVPRRVLQALGLSEPVVGVFRPRGRKHYSVTFPDLRTGRKRTRAFSWREPEEEIEAYAQAIALRNTVLRRRG
jgi:hypothetical protein